jgi:hypothetical protein
MTNNMNMTQSEKDLRELIAARVSAFLKGLTSKDVAGYLAEGELFGRALGDQINSRADFKIFSPEFIETLIWKEIGKRAGTGEADIEAARRLIYEQN